MHVVKHVVKLCICPLIGVVSYLRHQSDVILLFPMAGFGMTLNCSSPTPSAFFSALEKELFSKKLHRPVKSLTHPLVVKVDVTVVGILRVVRDSETETPAFHMKEKLMTPLFYVPQRMKNQAPPVNHDVLSRFNIIQYSNKKCSKIYFFLSTRNTSP